MRNIWSVSSQVLLEKSHTQQFPQLTRTWRSTMRRVAMGFLLAGLGLSALAWSAFAHHAFAGQYDKDNPIQLTGIVTKIEWMNPHARFYIDVKDESGNVTNWNIELGPPLVLRRGGRQQESFKEGGTVQGSGTRGTGG